MQSFWDYLRIRTRNSVLAGMQEAIEHIERTDTSDVDTEAAQKFIERYPEKPGGSLGENPATSQSAAAGPATFASMSPVREQAPENRPANSDGAKPGGLDAVVGELMRADTRPLDAFERRLQATNPAHSGPTPPQAPRKRGRPRKNP